MRKSKIPSDSELEALLNKERQERERRNRELLGDPAETAEEFRRRKASMLAAGELAILESEQLYEAKVAKQREIPEEDLDKSRIERLPLEDWKAYRGRHLAVNAIGLIVAGLLCGVAISQELWLVAISTLSVAWGQYFFYGFWKNSPGDNAEYEKYAAEAAGDKKIGWYLTVLGVFVQVVGNIWGFVGSI